MKRFNFNKPMVESPLPPKDINVLWVDKDENTGKVTSIKEFKNGEWVTLVSVSKTKLKSILIETRNIPDLLIANGDNVYQFSRNWDHQDDSIDVILDLSKPLVLTITGSENAMKMCSLCEDRTKPSKDYLVRHEGDIDFTSDEPFGCVEIYKFTADDISKLDFISVVTDE